MTAPAVNGSNPNEAPSVSLSFGELGVTGLKRFSGYVQEEYHRKLQGDKALQIYHEMETSSPAVGAPLMAIDLLMRQVEWYMEGEDENDPRVEFLEQCRTDMSQSWHDTLSEVLSMLPYGWSYHEIVYKRRVKGDTNFPDGKIGWKKWPIRAQVTRLNWEFDTDGGITGCWQLAPPDYKRVFLPIEKCLLFRPGLHKNNPEGKSVLRRAYRPWYFAKRIEELEGIGIERDLAGLPVIEVPAEICSENAPASAKATFEAFKKIVRNLRRDEQEGVVMPQEYDEHGNPRYKLSLLSTMARRQFDTTTILQRYNAQIAQTMLADFIQLGHEQVGSYALADSKTSLFSVALGAWLDGIAEVVNRYAIPRLLALNGMPVEEPPRLCHGDIEKPDLQALGDYLTKLSQAGMPLFPDRKAENILRQHADLPALTEEEMDARDSAIEDQKAADQEARMLEIQTRFQQTQKPVEKQAPVVVPNVETKVESPVVIVEPKIELPATTIEVKLPEPTSATLIRDGQNRLLSVKRADGKEVKLVRDEHERITGYVVE